MHEFEKKKSCESILPFYIGSQVECLFVVLIAHARVHQLTYFQEFEQLGVLLECKRVATSLLINYLWLLIRILKFFKQIQTRLSNSWRNKV